MCSCFFFKKQKLMDCDQTINFFDFNNYDTYCKVVYVYDGDSVHVVMYHPNTNKLIKVKCRLYGIDTPELRVAHQKEKGYQAKERLICLLKETQYMVNVECKHFDKYGRVLIVLYSEKHEKSLNQILVDEGHALAYFGKKKKEFT